MVPSSAQRLDVVLLLDTQGLVVQRHPLPRFALHVRYVVATVGGPPLVRQHRYQVVVPCHPLRRIHGGVRGVRHGDVAAAGALPVGNALLLGLRLLHPLVLRLDLVLAHLRQLRLHSLVAELVHVQHQGEAHLAQDLRLHALGAVVGDVGLPEEAHELHGERRGQLGHLGVAAPEGARVEGGGVLLAVLVHRDLHPLVQVVHLGGDVALERVDGLLLGELLGGAVALERGHQVHAHQLRQGVRARRLQRLAHRVHQLGVRLVRVLLHVHPALALLCKLRVVLAQGGDQAGRSDRLFGRRELCEHVLCCECQPLAPFTQVANSTGVGAWIVGVERLLETWRVV
mmetsp:Transcript_19100/g.41818  ORF Transcript_19100/g.41818 Transcript_19100/m.41818 type:complete len:342 (+) Transcript_19100:151-1176(+)